MTNPELELAKASARVRMAHRSKLVTAVATQDQAEITRIIAFGALDVPVDVAACIVSGVGEALRLASRHSPAEEAT